MYLKLTTLRAVLGKQFRIYMCNNGLITQDTEINSLAELLIIIIVMIIIIIMIRHLFLVNTFL